jgi:hypothetical protein
MTWWLALLIIAGDLVCVCIGFSHGWHRGFDDAEAIWEPCCNMLHDKFKQLMRDLTEPPT